MVAKARETFGTSPAVAMPIVQLGCIASVGEPVARQHQDHTSMKGVSSEELLNLVHTPVPMSKAFKMPAAKAAVDAEWNKHHNRTWL